MRNWLVWLPWLLTAALRLMARMGDLQREVPEATASISASLGVIRDRLAGGITEGEAREIQEQLGYTWTEISDVIRLMADVCVPGRDLESLLSRLKTEWHR